MDINSLGDLLEKMGETYGNMSEEERLTNEPLFYFLGHITEQYLHLNKVMEDKILDKELIDYKGCNFRCINKHLKIVNGILKSMEEE